MEKISRQVSHRFRTHQLLFFNHVKISKKTETAGLLISPAALFVNKLDFISG